MTPLYDHEYLIPLIKLFSETFFLQLDGRIGRVSQSGLVCYHSSSTGESLVTKMNQEENGKLSTVEVCFLYFL